MPETYSYEFSVKSDTGTVPASDSNLAAFMKAVLDMSAKVSIKKFAFRRKPGGPTPSTVYDYEIELVDGRTWIQTIDFTTSDPTMTFAVTSSWRQSEFAMNRTVRDATVALRIQHGALSEITVAFKRVPP